MNHYILFMHNDVPSERRRPANEWETYFSQLRELGAFQGGSAIGDGLCVSKSSQSVDITRQLSGYIRIRAASLEAARQMVVGNPVYEAGGTVEVRELPKT